MPLYKGFSTYNRDRKFRITDYELIKQDLYNNFNIRKGEKLMQPDFGTIIWDTLFEPLTQETIALITNDIKRIAAYDPRLSIESVSVNSFDSGIQIQLNLRYVASNQVENIKLSFDKENIGRVMVTNTP